MKKLVALVLSAVMFASFACGCSSKGEDKKFIVGFDSEFPPMGFIDDSGNYVGFDLELAAEVAKRLDMEFVAQPIAWDSKDTELASGNIDCIWNGFTITGREDQYTWSEPYMANSQVVVVRSDSGIAALEDLAGKSVCVQKDSSGLAAVEENPDLASTFAELVQVESYLNAMMELESGAVDAIVMDEIVARYELSNSDADLVVLNVSLAAEEYGVGFLLGNEELRDKVQNTLKEMKADGTLAKISEKWFEKDITIVK
ncbi:MAG: amino acid ABC transporter substrate-binding protein [Clostridia bacterium]|nr:amino acid ABC transporter substrate-binding protein [Clostridia bacterium]